MADSPLPADKNFTEKQIADFLALKSYLEERGWQKLVCHMQSSYGLLYYPMEGMQYVRPGIALYGCASNTPEEKFCVDLKPALQLKCRIGCIRTVEQGDFVSYGRTWEAKERRRVAVMAIGYADRGRRWFWEKEFPWWGVSAWIRLCSILRMCGKPWKEILSL